MRYRNPISVKFPRKTHVFACKRTARKHPMANISRRSFVELSIGALMSLPAVVGGYLALTPQEALARAGASGTSVAWHGRTSNRRSISSGEG